jgi:hypothetical protein
VVAEVDAVLVEALRRNKNCYTLNVAGVSDIRQVRIEGVELRDPQEAQDLNVLREALAAATEVVTALPSVQNFDRGMPSVAALIAAGLGSTAAGGTRVYAAENNHHAAECLKSSVGRHGETPGRPVRYLNTVIGKMSRVV